MSDAYLDSLGLITDRTEADVRAKNARGTYNASDMNRVVAAVLYLRPIFRDFGYSIGNGAAKDWRKNSLPRKTDADRKSVV